MSEQDKNTPSNEDGPYEDNTQNDTGNFDASSSDSPEEQQDSAPTDMTIDEIFDAALKAGSKFTDNLAILQTLTKNIDQEASEEIVNRFTKSNASGETLAELVAIVNNTELSPQARFLALCRYDEKVAALRLIACLPDKSTESGKITLSTIGQKDNEQMIALMNPRNSEELDNIFTAFAEDIYVNPEKVISIWKETTQRTDKEGRTTPPPSLNQIVEKTVAGRVPTTIKKTDLNKNTQSGSVIGLLAKKTGGAIANTVLNGLQSALGQDKKRLVTNMVSVGILAKIASNENLSKYQITEIRRFVKSNSYDSADCALQELRLPANSTQQDVFKAPSPYENKIAESRRNLAMWVKIQAFRDDPEEILYAVRDVYNNVWGGLSKTIEEIKTSENPVGTVAQKGVIVAGTAAKTGVKVAGTAAKAGGRVLRSLFGNKGGPS